MDNNAYFLITAGSLLLLGMAADMIGRRTPLPRVTLLLLFGVAIGPSGLDLLPEFLYGHFDLIDNMTLLMVGFLIGGLFTVENLAKQGNSIIGISASAAIVTTAVVSFGLVSTHMPLEIALMLGAIVSATALAASFDVVKEMGSKSYFSKLLLAIVAIDDAWALIIFSLCISLAATLLGQGGSMSPLFHAGREIGGALLLGILLGIPGANLTGRIKAGQPLLMEALGLVFICGGLAFWLDVSFLIAAMVMGATIANLAKHHERPFHAIEGVEWPFLLLFFVLAGASFEISALKDFGFIGAAYVVFRVIGKIGPRQVRSYVMPKAQSGIGW
jgi:Kef-type K+ transport system membrane component KefB